MFLRIISAIIIIFSFFTVLTAQSKTDPTDKFRQLEEILPTANEYRTASGAPGHKYWQQRADYVIDVELDDVNQRFIGKETVTYKNLSPDTLNYLWLQLDQNIFAKDADSITTAVAPDIDEAENGVPIALIERLAARTYDGRVTLTSVKDARGNNLTYTVVKTMMRINLPQPLAPESEFCFFDRMESRDQ